MRRGGTPRIPVNRIIFWVWVPVFMATWLCALMVFVFTYQGNDFEATRAFWLMAVFYGMEWALGWLDRTRRKK